MKFRRLMDNAKDSTTFIGEGTRFTGEIKGEGHFVVCGYVDGDCVVDGSLTVAVDGQWKGTINASNIVIAGEVDGDVNARGQVEVAATAKVSGKLTGTSIAVAEGAIIDGSINVTGPSEILSFSEKRTAGDTDQEATSSDSDTQGDATS